MGFIITQFQSALVTTETNDKSNCCVEASDDTKSELYMYGVIVKGHAATSSLRYTQQVNQSRLQ